MVYALEVGPQPAAHQAAHPLLLLYRCIPIQRGSLSFQRIGSVLEVQWEACCCSCAPIRIRLEDVPKVCRQPLCSWMRLLRDVPISFLAAFLFHLIPSLIWGAEVSLGSPSNHQTMGVVWFAGWPIWFIIFQLLRPWGLHCPGTVDRVSCTGTFIPFASYYQAKAVAEWWAKAAAEIHTLEHPPSIPRVRFPPQDIACTAVGLAVVLALIANGVATLVIPRPRPLSLPLTRLAARPLVLYLWAQCSGFPVAGGVYVPIPDHSLVVEHGCNIGRHSVRTWLIFAKIADIHRIIFFDGRIMNPALAPRTTDSLLKY
eukprot:scaffold63935_cov39-Tisochrysis_lutea.AAC.1